MRTLNAPIGRGVIGYLGDTESMGDFLRVEGILADGVLGALLANPESLRQLKEALRNAEDLDAGVLAPAYTVDSLAAVLAVTPRVVRNAVARGELRAVKRGGRWLMPADAVMEWTHGEVSASFRRPRAPRRRGSTRLQDAFERFDTA